MKIKNILLFTSIMVLSAGLISCGKKAAVNKGDSAPSAQSSAQAAASFETPKFIVDGNNKFAIELYKKLNAGNEKSNVFFSPYSIYTAYAMLFEGTSSDTRTEFMDIFGFEENNLIRKNAFKMELSKYQNKGQEYGVFMANSLWVNKNFPVLDSYRKNLNVNYYAEAYDMDFSKSSASGKINKWVEKNTSDRIKNIIADGTLDARTKMVLVNTIYFKEKWQIAFDKAGTHEEDFYVPGGNLLTATFMKQKNKYFYSENKKVQVIKMKYKKSTSSNMSMIAVLPKDNNTSEAEKYIYDNSIEKINYGLTLQSGIVYFPKFELKWQLDIASIIDSMGITTSDYGRISKNVLDISSVIHSSFIKVDEEETEAAAATAIVSRMSLPIEREEPPFVFRADKPFVYLIIDDNDGKILFMGKMMNPVAKGK